MKKGRPARRDRTIPERPSRGIRPRDVVATLDAEDIALARLQAQLRKSEAVHVAAGPGKLSRGRTTISLPVEMLRGLRERARREGLRPSRIVEAALAQYLKLH
jgi:hypothetical protein